MELLLAALISTVLLLVAIPAFTSIYQASSFCMYSPPVQESATAMVGLIARDLRMAPTVNGAEITAATATSITIYTGSSGTTETYSVSNSNFQITAGGHTTTIASNAVMNIVYFKSSSYNSSGLTSYVPKTLADFQSLVAVKIAGKVANNGYAGTYTTMVRLRNTPSKSIAF